MKKIITILIATLVLCFNANAKTKPHHSVVDSLAVFHESTGINSGKIQQEMIYLHLDNTAYSRNDRIFFAGYLVTSGKLKPSDMSRTVYVELLNPSGKIINHCVLKTVDGRFHGSLLVNEQPFYSGYYEIRAYTRYMLSFGPEAAFSRVIPVFYTSSEDSDWTESDMLKYGSNKLTYSRPKPTKAKDVNLDFYPEGGRLVAGLPATVAFEVTDAQRRPLEATGRVIDCSDGSEVATFRSEYMGRGSFNFTPRNRKYRADVIVAGKRYSYNLPETVEQGINLMVDNMSSSDSVKITVSRTPMSPIKAVGATLTCRNELCGRAILDLTETDAADFTVARDKMPTGIIQLTLFDTKGSPVSDRLFFNNRNDFIRFDYAFDKPQYGPMEPVEMQVRMSSPAPFSISVTDSEHQVPYGGNIMSDLLLSSEIKGYVHNPAWYFQDSADTTRQRALDNLLMVQGWRRYPWSRLAGMEIFSVDSIPEKGIEVHGLILDRYRNKPQKGVNVAAMISSMATDSTESKTMFLDTYTTDQNGRFAFRSYVKGNYIMTLSTSKGKEMKPYRIILNSSEGPEVRGYDVAEMQIPRDIDDITFAFDSTMSGDDTMKVEENISNQFDKGKILEEIEVTATAAPWSPGQVVENAVTSYDIESAHNALLNDGKRFVRTLMDMLPLIDPDFVYGRSFQYKGKGVFFVLDSGLGNNALAMKDNPDVDSDFFDPALLPVENIKNVYINTKDEVIYEQICQRYPNTGLNERSIIRRRMGCVVFVELFPKMRVKMRPGMRRSTLEGYSEPVEFYSPDYSDIAPFDTDFRRTLYWNPEVLPDSTGRATVRFFNNSRAKRFGVSTATISSEGAVGGN